LSGHDSCANGYYDGGMIGGKVVTYLNICVCGRDAVSNEKSKRSCVLLASVGQYVGDPVDSKE
jgi:hypothetical protein